MTERCGAGAPARARTAKGGCPHVLRACSTLFAGAYAVVRAVLLEIFDEAAYTRFLVRRGIASSPAAYRHFFQEQQGLKARRPRCC